MASIRLPICVAPALCFAAVATPQPLAPRLGSFCGKAPVEDRDERANAGCAHLLGASRRKLPSDPADSG